MSFLTWMNFCFICSVIIRTFYLNLQRCSMRLLGKKIILKLKHKNRGNEKLCNEIDQLIVDFESFTPGLQLLKAVRKDADCVHHDGFYFFDIHIHRTLIMIEFDEDGEATIIWAGTHQEYEKTFKNNKRVIEKWLRTNNYID